jgi:hypothetical protein
MLALECRSNLYQIERKTLGFSPRERSESESGGEGGRVSAFSLLGENNLVVLLHTSSEIVYEFPGKRAWG